MHRVVYERMPSQILQIHIRVAAMLARVNRMLGMNASVRGQVVTVTECFRAIAATEFPHRFVRVHVHAQIGRAVKCLVALAARVRPQVLVLVHVTDVRGPIDVGALAQLTHVRFPSARVIFVRLDVFAEIHNQRTAVGAFRLRFRADHISRGRILLMRHGVRMLRSYCRFNGGEIGCDARIILRDEIRRDRLIVRRVRIVDAQRVLILPQTAPNYCWKGRCHANLDKRWHIGINSCGCCLIFAIVEHFVEERQGFFALCEKLAECTQCVRTFFANTLR